MKIPTDKNSLSVFLRDYGTRSHKTRGEKILIMKEIINTKTIMLDGVAHELTPEEYKIIWQLYHKYILGKWTTEISTAGILEVFKSESAKDGKTIRDISTQFNCTDEVIRQRIAKLVDSGDLIRDVNPENKRQGLFFKKSRHVREVVV